MHMLELKIVICIFLLLITLSSIQTLLAQNVLISNDRDGYRVWRPSTIITGDWNANDNVYEQDLKSQFVYSSLYPNVPVQINGFAGWDHQVFQWLPKSHCIYTYDTEFNHILQAEYQDSLNEEPIQPIYKYTFNYDAQDRLIEIYTYSYQGNTSTWIPNKRLHLTYLNGFLSSTMEWITYGTDNNYSRTDFEYDGNGRLSYKRKFDCQDSTSWYAAGLKQFIYHTNDTSSNEGFINYLSHTYPVIYPQVHNTVYGFSSDYYGMVSLINQGWMQGTTFFINNRYTNTYDANNRLTESLTEMYTTVWNNWSKFTMTYDTNSNPQYQVFYYWNTAIPDWDIVRRITYSWQDPLSNDDVVTQPGLVLSLKSFPNPFKNTLEVMIKSQATHPVSVKVYNIKGQSVYDLVSSPNETLSIDGSKLPTGIYLLKASQGKDSKTVKVMKVK
jgi:hypothetical protein